MGCRGGGQPRTWTGERDACLVLWLKEPWLPAGKAQRWAGLGKHLGARGQPFRGWAGREPAPAPSSSPTIAPARGSGCPQHPYLGMGCAPHKQQANQPQGPPLGRCQHLRAGLGLQLLAATGPFQGTWGSLSLRGWAPLWPRHSINNKAAPGFPPLLASVSRALSHGKIKQSDLPFINSRHISIKYCRSQRDPLLYRHTGPHEALSNALVPRPPPRAPVPRVESQHQDRRQRAGSTGPGGSQPSTVA